VITGAAAVPSAPLLVPGATERLSDGVRAIAEAVDVTLRGLPPHDVAVVVAAGAEAGVHAATTASLAGAGRPDLTVTLQPDGFTEGLAKTLGWYLHDTAALPLGLAVLAQLMVAARGNGTPVVPLSVDPSAPSSLLVTTGHAIVEASERASRRVAVVVAGDLSAGLAPKAPRAVVPGARAWTETVVDAVASGRLDRLLRLGPQEAQRVTAVGWAPLVVLHGVCERARLGTVVRRYAAPRGVGYLVASGG
jgi:hypothetical protein